MSILPAEVHALVLVPRLETRAPIKEFWIKKKAFMNDPTEIILILNLPWSCVVESSTDALRL